MTPATAATPSNTQARAVAAFEQQLATVAAAVATESGDHAAGQQLIDAATEAMRTGDRAAALATLSLRTADAMLAVAGRDRMARITLQVSFDRQLAAEMIAQAAAIVARDESGATVH